MTSPPKDIHVQCPACGKVYEDWFRPSMNLTLDNFDEDYLREASTATCPACGKVVELGVLIIDHDGTWKVPT